MNLDDQLSELLNQLGVALETPEEAALRAEIAHSAERASGQWGASDAGNAGDWRADRPFAADRASEIDSEASGAAEMSLFQTSREHYGVFYRLDLVAGIPQLRVFAPHDAGPVKMACYLVRPCIGTPIRDWFLATRTHSGSMAFDESRETTEQHLLFAAGEALKRLFWSGDTDEQDFPDEIEVSRLM